MDISSELQVIKPIITIYSNKFLSIENYVNIVEFDTNLIRVKTKEKIVKITGDKLVLKYINEDEIGIKGIINSLEFTD
ncbi:YabP/YqfC family sporulation protein [Intestinibacter bartlettii]|uniref:YabP/YqfC family sporulation protein n=1 Tax=Intestinibacter bartlettii TaxID=261299 RepID=UPI0022E7805E|nr:YabP/YqfC family sporulation protein [Intestinibacter bartlettii]